MAMQFNKPKFDWEAKDRLSELEQFKQECSVLFQGPLSEMKDAQKAGLIVNWIGHQCIMTLHSMGIALDRPKTVFDNLEKIFSPESNQTLSRFKFRGLKQKQSQTCDSYMSELRLAIVECRYPEIVQDMIAQRPVHIWSVHKRDPRPFTGRDSCGRYPREMLTRVSQS